MSDLIDKYCLLIQKFNPILNLISPKDLSSLRNKHVSDAIESSRVFLAIHEQSTDYSIFDIGSGNGTPGLIWAILNPSVHHSLVEIDQRKAEFLKHCCRSLKLTNANVLNEDFNKVQYPSNAIITARAFMNLNKLMKPGGIVLNYPCYFLKGSTWNKELDGIESIFLKPYQYNLDNGTERTLLEYLPVKN